MLRIKILGLISALFLSFNINAQEFPSEYWHFGEVDLNDGTTLKGKLKYSLEEGVESIQIIVNGVIKSFGAQNVRSFQIMDAMTRRERYFYSLPFKQSKGYVKNHFFELLEDGEPYILLIRERIAEISETSYDPYWGSNYNSRRRVLVYDFYLMDMYAEIRQVDTRKLETMLVYFGKYKDKVEAFIKVNKLDYQDREDFLQIVRYYDTLVEPEVTNK
ncbi:hypothetical protein KMW28_09525 [Flammeovirga yaeyamensis]|uniref:DUF4369 domain-containing protein n=1 Tax=Flammeovirga yaeyamensis TaxID=367791 RepID=A0AAX1N9H8_9BACT|nr:MULTISPECIES: hypothetical protein [Flammeovirga]ANQ48719.1 hypothetical protein MY04_1343 [Flammeovirga sp. MY04]MBB3698800.1 hypothetical protein [Flammeovirga yaeyamensis]NMF37385.1 hypothetical protein [Flammeovirga yaeyamensis]QWG03801.1 hypothetical protein KMW28_09525 [Flammeovirga yaeyamensis]